MSKKRFAVGRYVNGKRVITLADGTTVTPKELVEMKMQKAQAAASIEEVGEQEEVITPEPHEVRTRAGIDGTHMLRHKMKKRHHSLKNRIKRFLKEVIR